MSDEQRMMQYFAKQQEQMNDLLRSTFKDCGDEFRKLLEENRRLQMENAALREQIALLQRSQQQPVSDGVRGDFSDPAPMHTDNQYNIGTSNFFTQGPSSQPQGLGSAVLQNDGLLEQHQERQRLFAYPNSPERKRKVPSNFEVQPWSQVAEPPMMGQISKDKGPYCGAGVVIIFPSEVREGREPELNVVLQTPKNRESKKFGTLLDFGMRSNVIRAGFATKADAATVAENALRKNIVSGPTYEARKLEMSEMCWCGDYAVFVYLLTRPLDIRKTTLIDKRRLCVVKVEDLLAGNTVLPLHERIAPILGLINSQSARLRKHILDKSRSSSSSTNPLINPPGSQQSILTSSALRM